MLPASGCGEGSRDAAAQPSAATTAAPAKTTPTSAADPGTRITLAGSQYGKMLFNGRGQAIYLFAKEKTSRPECYGECEAAWPPVYTKGTPRAGPGIRADLLGTTKRSNGRLQVTYGGHPLYFYANEGLGRSAATTCSSTAACGSSWALTAGP